MAWAGRESKDHLVTKEERITYVINQSSRNRLLAALVH